MLIVITGVRGAGKTTLRDRLEREGIGRILKPSTTRPPRSETDDEYNFVSKWSEGLYAWTITNQTSNHKYGFRKSEIAHARDELCFAVFDPLQLSVLRNYAKEQPFETIVVGLDTVPDLSVQAERVAGDGSRSMSADDFERAKQEVAHTDLVLCGNEEVVFRALSAAVRLLVGRGGTLTRRTLEPLIAAGVLLEGSETNALRHASYDLRLGKQVWTNRTLVTLSDQVPTFEIAPYSYAIVTAEESAHLPTFITALFDIKVSLFLRGVVLSNGPQIDPGYRGQLFCMLFNGSSASLTLSMGSHFATLEFSTTTETTEGYRQKYQLQQKLGQIMNEGAMSGPGGNIIGDYDKKISQVAAAVDKVQGPQWALIGAMVAVALVPLAVNYVLIGDAQHKLDDAKVMIAEFESRLSSAPSSIPSDPASSQPSATFSTVSPSQVSSQVPTPVSADQDGSSSRSN